jgi:DNA helicase-2/ATP-dependent DNA helicase PcrA
LEWPVVFVTGLERGLVPISWATDPGDLDEERRLLHVALSRAAEELHCSWARTRLSSGRRVARDPSPWLGDLEHAARAFALPATGLTDRVSEMREVLAASTAPAPRTRRRAR